MKGPQLGLHVKTCTGPWGDADWERHRQQSANRRTALRSNDLEEGEDYIVCQLCGDRFRKLSVHLKEIHRLPAWQYRFRYGPTESKKTRRKTRATCLERYGVEHPLQVPEIAQRANRNRKATMMERYGAPCPFTAGFVSPNKKSIPEKEFDFLTVDTVMYVGDFSYWIRCLGSDGKWRNRNPDFVIYSSENLKKIQNGELPNTVRTWGIIEIFGDHWHSQAVTGMGRQEYETFRRVEYESVGVKALFVWVSDLRSDPQEVKKHVDQFIYENSQSSS